jgi:thioesterase domain-containing protein/acyl carrier protein
VRAEAASSMIEILTPIWQRVLQQSSIGVNDNFFDLGGDSSLALQLFTEVSQVCGRELPPVMIYQAPTIADLAALLEQPTTPRFPALVPLKGGADKPPVFLAHGLGGSVMDFFQPVRYIQSEHPIYGLQARGIDGVDEPLDSIEAMAQFHIDAIRELQPHGPYFLIGYSLGGLVALEMAQRLSSNGERVALLAMLDAYPYIRFMALKQQIRLIAHQVRRGLSNLRSIGVSSLYQPPAGVSLTPAMQHVRERGYLALTRYRPRLYGGKIKFVRAAITSGFPDDPVAVWSTLAGKFEVETVPGDHLGIIATHFEDLASALTRYLNEVDAERPCD